MTFKNSHVKTLLEIAWIYELVMSIPFVSIWFAWTTGGMTVLVGLCLHVALAVLASKSGDRVPWQIGVVAAVLSFVPIIGWLAHCIAAIAYSFARNGQVVTYKGFMRPRDGAQGSRSTHTTQKSSGTSGSKEKIIRDAEIVD